MKFTKLVKILAGTTLAIGSLAVGTGISSNTTTVQAKTKSTKVVKAAYKKLSKKAYHVTKGTFYSTSKLTKKNHYAKNYPHTTFYTYTQATVTRANGKKAIYYYVKTSNGKVKGWIWHSYLKKGVAPKKATSNTTSTTTPKAPITPLVGSDSTSSTTSSSVKAEQAQVQVLGPISQGNKVLASGTVDIKDGDTAFSVLQKLGVSVSYTGDGDTTYVTNIDGLQAGTAGTGGGWLYCVNGSFPTMSAGAYTVKSGDTIQWVWTDTQGDRGWTGD